MNKIKIYDTNGNLCLSFIAHDGEIVCIAFSLDFSLIASFGRDCCINIWKLHNYFSENRTQKHDFGECNEMYVIRIQSINTNTHVCDLSISPDNLFIASRCSMFTKSPIKIWDINEGELFASLEDKFMSNIVFSNFVYDDLDKRLMKMLV